VLPLLLACKPGTLVLVPLEGQDDSAVDLGHPHAGAYAGTISWQMPEWEWVICEGSEALLSVDDEGALEAAGICRFTWDDTGEDLDWSLSGRLFEDGGVEGEIVFDTWAIGEDGYFVNDLDADLEGGVEAGEVGLTFEARSFMGEYGFQDVTGSLVASVQAQ